MHKIAIQAEQLEKKFGDFVAVDQISFRVDAGEIYGFLGANGAGKSTTIRMLCGLLEPTSGDACVAGYRVRAEPDEIKKRIGYMSQRFSFYGSLTVEENLAFYAGMYDLAPGRARERTRELVERTELRGNERRLVAELPAGIKQRVALACALVHEPEIVFLDEPTAGVDPLLRRRFWEIIDGLSAAGTTVFVTTHYMDEVEHCHRLSLMNAGRIIMEGTVGEIKKKTFPLPILEIETDDVLGAYRRLLPHEREIGEVMMHGSLLHVAPVRDARTTAGTVERILREGRIRCIAASEVPPSMEDVFVKLMETYVP